MSAGSASGSPRLLDATLATLTTFVSTPVGRTGVQSATLLDIVGAVAGMLVANRNLIRREAVTCVLALVKVPGCCLDHDAKVSGRGGAVTIMAGLRTAVHSLDLSVETRESAAAAQAKLDAALGVQVSGVEEGGGHVTCQSIFQADVTSATAQHASDPGQLKVGCL